MSVQLLLFNKYCTKNIKSYEQFHKINYFSFKNCFAAESQSYQGTKYLLFNCLVIICKISHFKRVLSTQE
jgi:hypothetical protein